MNKNILKEYNKILGDEKPIIQGTDQEVVDDIKNTIHTSDDFEDEATQDVQNIPQDITFDDEMNSEFDTDVTQDVPQNVEFNPTNSLNSLYVNGDDYKENHFKYVNGFWVGCLGILILANRFTESEIIHNYLMRPAPITEENIEEYGDYMTDVIASVKALHDNETMTEYTWEQFLMYFRRLANTAYSDIDFKKFKELVNEMIETEVRPHIIIRSFIYDFIDGKIEPNELIVPLYRFNEFFKLSPQFTKFCLLHRNELFKGVELDSIESEDESEDIRKI